MTSTPSSCEFLEDAHNVVLVGGPGTEQGRISLRRDRASRPSSITASAFGSSPPSNCVVNALEQAKLQGKPGQIAARLITPDLVILDELGYLPFSASGEALLLPSSS